ncbi:peroxiredoxin Q/BCP [Filimonas lacunae]|uniref:thioredoxin-dependent peroxiredoxin n=1 Tax=Filimonas lacunae TaxID=477680 RepID=A0A173MBJ9_9BACT|nr:peroxiredoxin [Filimonas lacunae]BAV04906.1 thiol peroxidase, Bcp-type [Filimonas lacunae]SIT33821.1 peroxiredoxin Q/BCP [Filimonas lacunae]
MATLQAGDHVPDFTLRDQYNNPFSMKDHRGDKIVLYFYPKDESAVCTKEACAFRDSFQEFMDKGILVIGINAGSSASHKAFAEKNRLPFTLLSDPGNKVLKAFGIQPWLFLTGRETFLIDEQGKVEYTYRAFLKGDAHPQKVLAFLQGQ